MSLTEQLTTDIASAMKARDPARLTALRMLKAALMNKEIEKARALGEAEEQQVVASLLKQRRDSIEQFRAGAREDLVVKEEAEILILETYLPPPIPPHALEAAIDQAVAHTGATGAKDIGRVMKAVMATLSGQTVDGRRVNELVRQRLGE